jgi:CheY-like chemotaxis protein
MSGELAPILVVEDVKNILDMLAMALRFKGYRVVTATNGKEALERIAEQRPSLVITDVLMPKMDGYALAQHLRTNPETDQIPIVFLSATYVTPEDKEFALKLGAVHFLEKPVDTEEFLLTIAEIVSIREPEVSPPLDERTFYQGYRERLENKLRHKSAQIARTERLIETLPEEQKPAFRTLLEEARSQHEEIQAELDEIYRILDRYEPE